MLELIVDVSFFPPKPKGNDFVLLAAGAPMASLGSCCSVVVAYTKVFSALNCCSLGRPSACETVPSATPRQWEDT